ncbi:MAG: hypothetical protein QG616_1380, partial [Pseudomonadota bacterium]|nr:hypothetical protein [Pseudomonadota bacterium]
IHKKTAPVVRTGIPKKEMSIEQRAHIALKRAMKLHREVTPLHATEYLDRHLVANETLLSDELTIGGIHDFCVFVFVARMALLARNHAGAARKSHPMLGALKNYRFECLPNEWTDNPYICVPRFRVARKPTGGTYAP